MATITIGVDLGGTHMRAGRIEDEQAVALNATRVNSRADMQQVLSDLYAVIEPLITPRVQSIGIGVPSVVDVANGIVYDVQNIPSWKEVHLKKLMEVRYGLPVHVNNDANCFALAEHRLGEARGYHSLVALSIGTGLGAGIIVNDKLYAGANCGAGEFGMVKYLDHYYEYYASGQFFANVHGISGEEVYRQALAGEAKALALYREFGIHLGEALKMVLYTYDPEVIVIGGSLKNAWEFYEQPMRQVLDTLAYPRSVDRLKISLSRLQHAGVLGAGLLSAAY